MIIASSQNLHELSLCPLGSLSSNHITIRSIYWSIFNLLTLSDSISRNQRSLLVAVTNSFAFKRKETYYSSGFSDGCFQSIQARNEEIFSTLRNDESVHRGRLQRVEGIKSNHGPWCWGLPNNWVRSVEVFIVIRNKLGSEFLSHTPGLKCQ